MLWLSLPNNIILFRCVASLAFFRNCLHLVFVCFLVSVASQQHFRMGNFHLQIVCVDDGSIWTAYDTNSHEDSHSTLTPFIRSLFRLQRVNWCGCFSLWSSICSRPHKHSPKPQIYCCAASCKWAWLNKSHSGDDTHQIDRGAMHSIEICELN